MTSSGKNDLDATTFGLWTYDYFGNNNIEINSNTTWWVDPTPYTSEEFDFDVAGSAPLYFGQTLCNELTVTEQANWFNGGTPGVLEVGYRGTAHASLPNARDLLSTCIHELGHELGIRSDVGSVFPLYASQVGGTPGVEVVAGEGGHISPESALMCSGCGFPNMRRLPSAVDSLVVAHAAGYTTLMLPRTEFIGISSDFSNSLNWIGGMTTSFVDATVRRGGLRLNPTASADMSFVNLTLTEGGYASTGSHLLDVAQTVTVDGAWASTPARLSVNLGGTLKADDVQLINSGELVMWGGLAAIDRLEVVGPYTGQFSMLPGATLRVDRLTGFGNNLQFLGNLQIGNSSGGILNVGANQSLYVLGAMTVGPSPGTSAIVTISAGAQADSGPLTIGSNGASGTVTVTGFATGTGVLSDWDVTGNLTVGSAGLGSGTMTIAQHATCDVTGAATVRGSGDSVGGLNLQSGGSFEVANQLSILNHGTVQLSGAFSELSADEIALSSGGTFSDGAGTTSRVNRLTGFGNHPSLLGSVEFGHPGGLAAHTVGAGQSLDVAEYLTIGDTAPATLNINGGGTLESGRSFVGRELGSSGSSVTVSGAGSRWDILDQLYVGGNETASGGASALTLSSGGIVDADELLTVRSGSLITVGTSSTAGMLIAENTLRLMSGGTVTVGTGGNLYANSIDLTAGGTLITTGPNSTVRTNGISGLGSGLSINGNLGIGWSGGSGVGALTIGGSQSLNVTSVLSLGESSNGTLTVTHGGHAQIKQARIGDHGSGALVVTGETSTIGQTGDILIGYSSSGATGNLRIEGGASLAANGHNGFLGVGGGTSGTALVSGANSRWTDLTGLYVGGNTVGPQGSGTLTVAGGGRVDVNSLLQVWNTGRVELLGSEINVGSFNVQSGGTLIHNNGTLAVSGGTFNPGTSSNYLIDGPTQNELSTVVLKNGASANIPHTLFVGYNHAGKLELNSNATVHSFNGRVGWTAGSSDGRVSVDGARWINAADLEIGVRHSGQMSIGNGGTVQDTIGAIGAVAGSTGQVTVSDGGKWQNSDALYVGGKLSAGGSGLLEIANAEVTASMAKVWPQGTMKLDNGTLGTASVELAGGILAGCGLLALGDEFSNSGELSPGLPIGTISTRGSDYQQSSAGCLAIDIGGRRLSDRVSISGGSATLGGGLLVSLVGSYVPTYGNEFEVLWAEQRVWGVFDPLKSILEPIGGGLGWSLDYRENSVVLQVVHATFLEADFDEDGDVDASDLARWQAGFGTGTLHTQGDADGDHDVDGRDFLWWQRQLGNASEFGVNAAVPEPNCLAVGLGFCSMLMACRSFIPRTFTQPAWILIQSISP